MKLHALAPGGSIRSEFVGVRPVVLCGGSGARLWPLSRSLYPKQLLALARDLTMLQATVIRTQGGDFLNPLVVTSEEQRFLVRDQLTATSLRAEAIILEPAGRNTAGAIALAAYKEAQSFPDRLMLVMPSDHVINDGKAFLEAVEAAIPAAQEGGIVTFGIEAGKPEIGYGYIEAGSQREGTDRVRSVRRFIEKPDLTSAEEYCASGNYFWNGGIFLFQAKTLLQELELFAPEIASSCERAMATATSDDEFIRPDAEHFLSSPSVSIDYAVMEKTDHAWVVPVSMGWSDIGSWDALWEVLSQDENQNVLQGDVLALDCHGSLLRSEDGVTIAAVGAENLVVVATRDAVLVIPRERAQDTKLLVEQLRANGNDLHALHHRVHRPWGTYQTTDKGDRFQTKRITVKPGEKLSLQMHHHRSEHWIVVRGTALVTIDDTVRLLQENESTYVPAGSTHRLENPGKIPLELIEVQCGAYVGEDDIVRFEDTYGRAPKTAAA